jgi:hypothetical protein
MTINILIYGLYKSIRKRRNMFPVVLRELEAKANVFNLNSFVVELDSNEEEEEILN